MTPGALGIPWRALGGAARATLGTVDLQTPDGLQRSPVATVGPRWWGVLPPWYPHGRAQWPVNLVDVLSFRLEPDLEAVAVVWPDRRVELVRGGMGPFEWALRVGSWARRACAVGGRLQAVEVTP